MSNRTTKIVGTGIAPLAASQIAGDLQNTVSAAGTTQATATPVYGDNVVVTTCAAGAGVILSGPNFGPGDDSTVWNNGANPLAVYGPVGATVNGQTANLPVYVQPGQSVSLRCIGTNFFAGQSALAAIATALVAAGNSQGTALALTSQFNQIGTCAASAGVILQSMIGLVYVFNGGANSCSVYPPTGGTINGGSANAAVTLTTLKGALLWCNGLNSYTVAGV